MKSKKIDSDYLNKNKIPRIALIEKFHLAASLKT